MKDGGRADSHTRTTRSAVSQSVRSGARTHTHTTLTHSPCFTATRSLARRSLARSLRHASARTRSTHLTHSLIDTPASRPPWSRDFRDPPHRPPPFCICLPPFPPHWKPPSLFRTVRSSRPAKRHPASRRDRQRTGGMAHFPPNPDVHGEGDLEQLVTRLQQEVGPLAHALRAVRPEDRERAVAVAAAATAAVEEVRRRILPDTAQARRDQEAQAAARAKAAARQQNARPAGPRDPNAN